MLNITFQTLYLATNLFFLFSAESEWSTDYRITGEHANLFHDENIKYYSLKKSARLSVN